MRLFLGGYILTSLTNKFNLDMYGCSVLLESIQEAVGHKKSEGENMIFNHVLFPTSFLLLTTEQCTVKASLFVLW